MTPPNPLNLNYPPREKQVKLLTYKNCIFLKKNLAQTSLTYGIIVPLSKMLSEKKIILTNLLLKKNIAEGNLSPSISLFVKTDFFFTVLIINKKLYSNSLKCSSALR